MLSFDYASVATLCLVKENILAEFCQAQLSTSTTVEVELALFHPGTHTAQRILKGPSHLIKTFDISYILAQ